MIDRRVVLLGVLLLVGCGTAPAPLPAPEQVEFSSGQEKGQGILFRPATPGPHPAVVWIHGDFGLDEGTKEQAGSLARAGYVVLAVDLYRGEKVDNTLDAHIMDRGLEREQVLSDLKGAVSYLANQKEVKSDCLGVVGTDMGGGHALDLALVDQRLQAVVTCYGRLVSEPATLEPLQAPILGIYAEKDVGITPDTLKDFREAMSTAGKKLVDLVVYPDCDRGFVTKPGSEKEKQAAADARAKIEKFLAEQLKR